MWLRISIPMSWPPRGHLPCPREGSVPRGESPGLFKQNGAPHPRLHRTRAAGLLGELGRRLLPQAPACLSCGPRVDGWALRDPPLQPLFLQAALLCGLGPRPWVGLGDRPQTCPSPPSRRVSWCPPPNAHQQIQPGGRAQTCSHPYSKHRRLGQDLAASVCVALLLHVCGHCPSLK